MTKLKQVQLQQQILELVRSADFDYLFTHIDYCCAGVLIVNGRAVSGSFGFTATQIAPYIYQKLGYKVRKDIIKHALIPIKKCDIFWKYS